LIGESNTKRGEGLKLSGRTASFNPAWARTMMYICVCARGIDYDGHVANYVETEQIIVYKSHTSSFVQVKVGLVGEEWAWSILNESRSGHDCF